MYAVEFDPYSTEAPKHLHIQELRELAEKNASSLLHHGEPQGRSRDWIFIGYAPTREQALEYGESFIKSYFARNPDRLTLADRRLYGLWDGYPPPDSVDCLRLSELFRFPSSKVGNHIYAVWNNQRCLYIGKTVRGVKRRLKEHIKLGDRIGCYISANQDEIFAFVYTPDDCAEILDGYTDDCDWRFIDLDTAERNMIRAYRPLFNIIHI